MRAPRALISVSVALALAAALAWPVTARADELAAPLPSQDIRRSLIVKGAFDLGTLPHAAPGLSLGFDVRAGAIAFTGVASAFLAETDHASGASVSLYDTIAMICGLAPVTARFDAGVCGGLGVGFLRSERSAVGAVDSGLRVRPEGLATARFDLILVPGLLLSLDAGTVLDPLRTELPLTGVGGGDAARSSLFSFRSSLGLHLRLW
jgi:hypothetical protein